MTESPENKQNDFMIERIKQRPINKKRLLFRTIVTAAMAVIFGLIACFTFLVLEPVISNILYPEEETQLVVFPEDQEEMSPEEMLTDNMQQQNQVSQTQQPEEPAEAATLNAEQVNEILSRVTLDLDNYKQLYSSMYAYVQELNQYMVTVTGVSSNVDWLNNVQESENCASGVIIAENGRELLILTDFSSLYEAESISLEFYTGLEADAEIMEVDSVTNLAVLSVELEKLGNDFLLNDLKIAVLGSSNVQNMAGTPVVAVGRPMGTAGSIGYGMITSGSEAVAGVDINYKLLQTDIIGSKNAGGVLFNMQGQVIGIIVNAENEGNVSGMIKACGITELKKRVEKMSNGNKLPYLGISGAEVTRKAHEELGVPYGAYIKEVEMNSPAMLAGIQQGDVLVKFGERNVQTFSEYTTSLMQKEAGDILELTVMRLVQDEYKEMRISVMLEEL